MLAVDGDCSALILIEAIEDRIRFHSFNNSLVPTIIRVLKKKLRNITRNIDESSELSILPQNRKNLRTRLEGEPLKRTMSSLVILALMIVSGTSLPLSSKEQEGEVSSSSEKSQNDLDFGLDKIVGYSRTKSDGKTSEEVETLVKAVKNENEDISKLPESSMKKSLKKNRKHKTVFHNYPFVPRINRKQQMVANHGKHLQYHEREQRKKMANRKRHQQESQIYYIKLPPTPYTYVPGFGYISQPPTYSSPGIQKPSINHVQRPSRPQINHEKPVVKNPFIKVPVDFVSNGKPTGVYQWPAKRRESTMNRLEDGPYVFNGRPTSLYLLKSNGKKVGHQPIRLQDTSNEVYH